jgi:UDP-glucose 4-epimerase
MNILVVGGAGYIGSHCVRQLLEAGHTPIVFDNLSTGHRRAVPNGVWFCDNSNLKQDGICTVLEAEKIEAVMHFAACANVGESVKNPMKYYINNVGFTMKLLGAMKMTGVNKMIFSSTCAVYGNPLLYPPQWGIDETSLRAPINPYGWSKLCVENMLTDLHRSEDFRFVGFRYFNAAGAHESGEIGEDHDPETHLIPLAIKAAMGLAPALNVFGGDYNTPDGTCQRDYVHVDDICRAHILALKLLDNKAGSFYNIGTGNPTSVLQVLKTVDKVSGKSVPFSVQRRREGDAAILFADAEKIKAELGWAPRYTQIDPIIETAYRWHYNNPEGHRRYKLA